jgi:DNA-binding CsgD family transcriptional regulator
VTAVFGRERELALVDGLIESAGERFSVLLFEGEAGIGKTTIWREACRRGEARGFQVLACRPAEAETKLALSALADLLEGVPEEVFAGLPAPQQRALAVALLRVEPGAASPDPRTLGTSVRSLLAGLSEAGPLLVAVDDVQWLDATSARVLEFALRRLTTAHLGWLVVRRLPTRSSLAAEAVVPPESLTRATIGPLSLGALHHVLGQQLELAPTRSLLVRIHRASGGNPFYALEIARELLRTGRLPTAGDPLPVPDDLRKLIAGRLRRLPGATREALLVAAALAEPTTSFVDQHSLRAAEDDDLVRVEGDGRITFRHPIYASAVYEAASRPRRRELHLRLAGLVSEPEEQARHLALATVGPDEAVAAKLEDAADLARSRGAWASAAELLEQARGLTPPKRRDDAHKRGIAAARHHIHAGDRLRARTLLEGILAEHLPASLRADALVLLAEISFNDDNVGETVRLLTEAREHADEPRVAAMVQLGLSWFQPAVEDFSGGVIHADLALEHATESGDRSLIASALAVGAIFDIFCGQGLDEDKVERSLALEDAESVVPIMWRPSAIAACLYLWAGRYQEAHERLTAVRTAAADRGDESDLAFILLWLAWLETQLGRLAAAADLTEETANVAALTGSRTWQAFALAQRALVHAYLGEVAEARRDCAEAGKLLERLGNPQIGLWITSATSILELSLGNHEAAWHACEQVTEHFERQGFVEPFTGSFFVADALEALTAVGQLDRAEALLDAYAACGRRLDHVPMLGTAGRCRGLLRAARGDLAGAAAVLDQALVEHDRVDLPLERARTLLAKGVVERRARKRARAKDSFEGALALFEELGATLWAERARAELARLGLRRGAAGDLTENERRVAELASQGLTNREVAAALFVSPKTVEANLARVYRKLNIASRAELGGRMRDLLQA